MIKDLIKECVVNSQLGVSDLVEYCDVTKEDVQNILNDGDYSIDVADKIVCRLAMFSNKKDRLMEDPLPHIELENGMVLFRKDTEKQCRLLVVSPGINTIDKLTSNCYKISLK